MKVKKLMAVTLAATMVLGSSMTVFAADTDLSNGTAVSGDKQTGEAITYPHVPTDIYKVELPTIPSGSKPFDYRVDPERLINKAGTLENGTAVKANTDGIYFPQPTDASGNTVYGSSQKVTITGKNSMPIKVSATAVAKEKTPATDIAMAADQATFDTAAGLGTTATLLMKLKVGTTEKVIPGPTTTAGATITYMLPGQPANFIMKKKADTNAFEYGEKEGAVWKGVDVQLAGKVNQVTIGNTQPTAPNIELTWTVQKPIEPTTTTSTLTKNVDGTITFDDMKNAEDVTSVAVLAKGSTSPDTLTESTATDGTTFTPSTAGWVFKFTPKTSDEDSKPTGSLKIAGKKLTPGATVIVTFDNLTTVKVSVGE